MAEDDPGSSEEQSKELLSRRRLLQGGAALAAAGLRAHLGRYCGRRDEAVQLVRATLNRNSVKKTNLTLMTWELFEPQEIGAWKKTIAKFEAANPSIKVSWVGWPFATYDQNVTAQAQAGHVTADVVMCPPELASTLIDDYGICIPVGDIAHEVGLVPDASHKQYIARRQALRTGSARCRIRPGVRPEDPRRLRFPLAAYRLPKSGWTTQRSSRSRLSTSSGTTTSTPPPRGQTCGSPSRTSLSVGTGHGPRAPS